MQQLRKHRQLPHECRAHERNGPVAAGVFNHIPLRLLTGRRKKREAPRVRRRRNAADLFPCQCLLVEVESLIGAGLETPHQHAIPTAGGIVPERVMQIFHDTIRRILLRGRIPPQPPERG